MIFKNFKERKINDTWIGITVVLFIVGIIIGAIVTVSRTACWFFITIGCLIGGVCGVVVAGLGFILFISFKKIFKSKLTTNK